MYVEYFKSINNAVIPNNLLNQFTLPGLNTLALLFVLFIYIYFLIYINLR